jgi:hypothetical protein
MPAINAMSARLRARKKSIGTSRKKMQSGENSGESCAPESERKRHQSEISVFNGVCACMAAS